MDKKEATRTCGKCHREVAETNFALHETHCSRFLCLCPDCDEAVPREQLNQHREEQHTQVRCSKCNQKMERCYLMDHESDECVERLQSCQFCELELPWKELDKHHLACGSRTNLCGDCGRYVTLRDQPEHDLTCSATHNGSGPPQTPSKRPPKKTKIPVSCDRCMASFPAEDIKKHEVSTCSGYLTGCCPTLECVPATTWEDEEAEAEADSFPRHGATSWLSSAYKATALSDRPSSGPWGDEGDPDQISICPHCHLALPLVTLRRHKVKCQIHLLLK